MLLIGYQLLTYCISRSPFPNFNIAAPLTVVTRFLMRKLWNNLNHTLRLQGMVSHSPYTTILTDLSHNRLSQYHEA